MSKTWLILDSNFLCHRAKHATGGLSYDETPTGVVFGFLSYIPALQQTFKTKNLVFCWDSKTNLRSRIYTRYKANRAEKFITMTDDEVDFELAFRKQMKKLRRIYLPTIGFRNVFCQKGYESDDLIASVCLHSLPDAPAQGVIISSDQDLFQLIRPNVSVYNPITRKTTTLQSFKSKYGIHPSRWAQMKAIAGCSGDNVKGIEGVGEVTALKYLKNELKTNSKAHEKITSTRGKITICKNLPLVQLPYNEVKIFKLKKDRLSEEGWAGVCAELGMDSLKLKMPFGVEKRR